LHPTEIATPRCHLADDEVRPAGAHVLDGDERARRHELEAGLEEQLLGEGVADLHGRALLLALSSNSAEAMVAPWMPSRPVGADVEDRVADALGLGRRRCGRRGRGRRHGVDEDVAVVAGSKLTSPPTVGTPTQLP
jgi:hypothetical protein